MYLENRRTTIKGLDTLQKMKRNRKRVNGIKDVCTLRYIEIQSAND